MINLESAENLLIKHDINSWEMSAELLRDINNMINAMYRIDNAGGFNGGDAINSGNHFDKIIENYSIDAYELIDKLEIIRANLFGQVINWDVVQAILEKHEEESAAKLAKDIAEFFPRFSDGERKAVQKWLIDGVCPYFIKEAMARCYAEDEQTLDKLNVMNLSERTWELARSIPSPLFAVDPFRTGDE